jgi:hypothetical protein
LRLLATTSITLKWAILRLKVHDWLLAMIQILIEVYCQTGGGAPFRRGESVWKQQQGILWQLRSMNRHKDVKCVHSEGFD